LRFFRILRPTECSRGLAPAKATERGESN
jgi:hypothetical protein